MKNRIRIARGTKAQLNTVNTVLPAGTPIFTTDENRLYIGDGVTQGKNLTAINVNNAENVTDKINGKSISLIFESDGKTAQIAKNSIRSNTVTYISDNIVYEIIDETTVLDFLNRVLTNQIKVLSIGSVGNEVIPEFIPSSMRTTGSSALNPANYKIRNLYCAPSLASLGNDKLSATGYCQATLSGGSGTNMFIDGTYELHIGSEGVFLDYYLQYMNYTGTSGTNASIYQVYGSDKPLTKFAVKYFI